MGMAIISTREIMNESFFLSPLMAPAVAMAAETPHMETAAGQHCGKFIIDFQPAGDPEREIPNYRDNDYCLYQSERACCHDIFKKYRCSQQHKSDLTKSSVCTPARNHAGNLNRLPISSPSSREKSTVSRPNALNSVNDDRNWAKKASRQTAMKPIKYFLTNLRSGTYPMRKRGQRSKGSRSAISQALMN